MPLTLTYRASAPTPVEVEGLTLDGAADHRLAEIERVEICHGNARLPLAEMFSVAGDPRDKCFEFVGDLYGVH